MNVCRVSLCDCLAVLGVCLWAVDAGGAAETSASTEGAIRAVLKEYWSAYADRDLERVMALHVPDHGVVCLGTGRDEKYVGAKRIREGLKRDFAQSQSVSVERDWMCVSSLGDVAWVAAGYIVKAKVQGEEVSIDARLTAVLAKSGDKWLIRQWHLSAPMSGQEAGKSFPKKRR